MRARNIKYHSDYKQDAMKVFNVKFRKDSEIANKTQCTFATCEQ